jgi:hypothetical protein
MPTTSRKASKKNGKPRIGKGKMVRVKRKDLYHLLTESQRAYLPSTGPVISGDYPCVGKVVGGSSNNGWIIAFDDMPESEKRVTVNRKKVALLEKGEYDVPISPRDDDDDDDDDEDDNCDDNCDGNGENSLPNTKKKRKRKKKKLSPEKQSVKSFCLLDDKTLKDATAFDYHWGRDGCNNQKAVWKIHGETEYITD